jgi:hypothetical protein
VPQAFSLSPARCKVISDPKLREEIQAHTGSTDATAKILRSIERFGTDPSILRYDMNPKPQNRTVRSTETVAWAVHALRNRPEPEVVPPSA